MLVLTIRLILLLLLHQDIIDSLQYSIHCRKKRNSAKIKRSIKYDMILFVILDGIFGFSLVYIKENNSSFFYVLIYGYM